MAHVQHVQVRASASKVAMDPSFTIFHEIVNGIDRITVPTLALNLRKLWQIS